MLKLFDWFNILLLKQEELTLITFLISLKDYLFHGNGLGSIMFVVNLFFSHFSSVSAGEISIQSYYLFSLNTLHVFIMMGGACVLKNTSEVQHVKKKKKKSHAALRVCFKSRISEPPSYSGSTADWDEIRKQFSLMEMFLYWSWSWINWIHVTSAWKSNHSRGCVCMCVSA